jgi:sugar phosphate isomerase/epimerase
VVAQRLAPAGPAGPRACLQLFTVRHALARDRAGTFRRLYELGFRAIETAGFSAELPSAARRSELETHGLEVVSSYFVGPSDRFAEHLDEQQAFGNDTVIVGLDATYYTDKASVLRAVEVVNGFADQCAAKGMRLGYHNHPWEVSVLEDGQVALALLADGLRDDVFFEFDYYWAQVGGLAIQAARAIVEPRLERLHLKDGPLTDSQQASIFGEGAFDLAAAIHAAPGARWHIIAFDEFDGDMLEASGSDLGYLLDNRLSVAELSAAG